MGTAKVSKASVDYRPASPLELRRRCGSCSMYRTGGACTLVAGRVLPLGLCDRWAARRRRGSQLGDYLF